MTFRNTRLGVKSVADVKSHPFFRQDNWSWSTVRECVAPVVPELSGPADTTYFDEIDDTPQQPNNLLCSCGMSGNMSNGYLTHIHCVVTLVIYNTIDM